LNFFNQVKMRQNRTFKPHKRTAVLSRVAVMWPKNMLHDARMAGLAKLRRSIRSTDERQLRAVHVGRGEIV
jgi:hypothetical protein